MTPKRVQVIPDLISDIYIYHNGRCYEVKDASETYMYDYCLKDVISGRIGDNAIMADKVYLKRNADGSLDNSKFYYRLVVGGECVGKLRLINKIIEW